MPYDEERQVARAHDLLEDERWLAHAREHGMLETHRIDRARIYSEDRGVREQADEREREIHAEAHRREHAIHAEAHRREHAMTEANIDKATRATDLRFEAVAAGVQQLRDLALTHATQERVDQLVKDIDRRFDDLARTFAIRFDDQAKAITNIEKNEVKGEGRTIGQGVVIAAIVGVFGFVFTALSIAVLVGKVFG